LFFLGGLGSSSAATLLDLLRVEETDGSREEKVESDEGPADAVVEST